MTMPPIRRQTVSAFALLLSLALTSMALAQGVRVLGTIEGTLGGEPRTWYALDYGLGPEGPEPTATYSDFGFALLSISIVANPEQRFTVEGAISIDITAMAGLDCPCVFDDAAVVYWSGSSMFSDLYVSDDPGRARVTITRWEQVSDGVFALEGEVEAELVYLEGLAAEPDGGRTLRLEAVIALDEVPEEVF
jgi:hypothetical protein